MIDTKFYKFMINVKTEVVCIQLGCFFYSKRR